MTTVRHIFKHGGDLTLDRRQYTYNGLNQLDRRMHHTDVFATSFDVKWLYTSDTNGNLPIAEKQNGSSVKQEKWAYSWNPRDQMSSKPVIPALGHVIPAQAGIQGCGTVDAVPRIVSRHKARRGFLSPIRAAREGILAPAVEGMMATDHVIPAQAGIQGYRSAHWILAFAGMTTVT